jgi:2-polyprenyl-3-methyl-5-hydroxy-6-metoxy-1,4-benzoquinol methylase
LKLPPQSFDTIVSTFTLCAYQNPEQVLHQFNTWCKPDGTILLMEYGLSKYNVVSWLQKKWEPYHYKKTGSHLDRDMLALISASKFRVKKIEIKYAGIVYLVWASLRPMTKS